MVLVHDDDRSGVAPDYAAFARAAVARVPGSAFVTVLRPGYGDKAGRRSAGETAGAHGNGYTRDRIEQVAASIEVLRRRYPNARTVLIGDGGGAAIVANLAGLRPMLADAMLLAACPCALPEWRTMMAKTDPAFAQPVQSLDPLQTVGGVAPGLRAAIVVGEDDKVTPPALSRTYAEALALRGIATEFTRLPGQDHEILDDPVLLQILAELAEAVAMPAGNI
ncbi:alpha/beta hydrolase [Sphingomonas baiyangensis]|uniref:Alpha/beta hydrolase n=2 Tax=Sphingomonas baiyangensis TaxID=2572576 RepID=A0A4U1L5L3_9SPHN|nr:alpha/beta hydrolase [Sphingomonas baiyangensis]